MTLDASGAELAEYTDEALAEALIVGNPAAPLVAWQRFRPIVMAILRRRAGASDVVDDVAQDVFLYFVRGVRALRHPGALRAFLATLAHRTLTNELRRRQRQACQPLEEEAEHFGAVGERADAFSRHAASRLRQLLARLRERERQVLLLCLVERRSIEEAAALLDLSPATIRRALTRAQRKVMGWGNADPFLCEFTQTTEHAKARWRGTRFLELPSPAL